MNILITSATAMELRPIRLQLEQDSRLRGIQLHFAVTGIGLVATSYHTTRLLQNRAYDWCWNTGIAGSFTPILPVGSVAVVRDDCFADWGIDGPQGAQSLFEAGLMAPDESPFTGGRLVCPYSNQLTFSKGISPVSAVTVNTVSGTLERIATIRKRFNPAIESMEGAAFFYVCLQEGIPFIQLRAISNLVEPRDKSKWNIIFALDGLTKAVHSLALSLA